jgi:hypothetical protein
MTGSETMTEQEEDEAIYAVALVTRSELNKLGPAFERAWPVERTPCFGELLNAIDKADQSYWADQDRQNRPKSEDRN